MTRQSKIRNFLSKFIWNTQNILKTLESSPSLKRHLSFLGNYNMLSGKSMYYHSIKSENNMEPSTVQSCVTIANGAPKTSVLGISIIVIVNNTNISTY